MYRANVHRDETGVWIARVPDLVGVHSNAKRLDQIAPRIAEAIAVALDIDVSAEEIVLAIDYRHLGLALEDSTAIQAAIDARAAMHAAQRSAEEASLAAVQTLASHGFTLRDIGSLIGMSHQRIHQLVSG
jgi:predicted RNase H-like HicB family nuclease